MNQYGATAPGARLEGAMPTFDMKEDLTGDLPFDSARVAKSAGVGRTDFLVYRSVLRDIDYYASLNALLRRDRGHHGYVFTTPQEFSYLARRHLGGDNSSRATYLYDTLPDRWQISTVKPVARLRSAMTDGTRGAQPDRSPTAWPWTSESAECARPPASIRFPKTWLRETRQYSPSRWPRRLKQATMR